MAFLDDAGLVKLWQHIQARLSNKVDKTPGKVLSSNDFTDEEKNSLAAISSDYLTSADKEEILSKIGAGGSGSGSGGGAFFEPDDGDLEGTIPTIDADTLGGLLPSSYLTKQEANDEYVKIGEDNILSFQNLPLHPVTSYDQIIMPDGSRWDGVASGGGNIDIDTTNLATRDYVDDKIANINIDTTNLATYDYVDEEIAKIAVKYFTNEDIDEITGGCPLVNYKTYTIRIDESNSNPLTACEYMDDAVGMEKGSAAWDSMPIFAEIKPCVFKNGEVVYYLNPNNFNLKTDGSDALIDGTDGDVMIEFRKFAYRLYKQGQYQYVSISNDPEVIAADDRFQYYAFTRDSVGDVDKLYISAFNCSYDENNTPYSVATMQQRDESLITYNQAESRLAQKGENYKLIHYAQFVALQCLYIIKYGNLNSQEALGQGYNAEYWNNPTVIGTTVDKGMYFGDPNDDTVNIKFAGIENLWGAHGFFLRGINSLNGSDIKITYGNLEYVITSLESNSRLGFEDFGEEPTIQTGVPSQIIGDTEAGFIGGGEYQSSTSEYYCDYQWIGQNGIGMTGEYNDYDGIFCLYLSGGYVVDGLSMPYMQDPYENEVTMDARFIYA